MQPSKQDYRIGPGASSLLMIFVALCMTTLAILTLVSAVTDERMTKRAQETVYAYYDGAAQAQRLLADLDVRLDRARRQADSAEVYADSVYALSGEDPNLAVQADAQEGFARIDFSAPMDDGRYIFVQLRVPLRLDGARFEVVRHAVENGDSWTPDDSMNLFGNEDALLSAEIDGFKEGAVVGSSFGEAP